jgi:hypothetical protein
MPSINQLLGLTAAVSLVSGFVLGSPKVASAQGTSGTAPASVADVVGELSTNEGIFVDGKTFKIAKGKAKGDPSAQIAKLGAKEVGPGAIIFRHGDKLYMVEGTPNLTPQAMKNFQDNWAVGYMKAFKEFQDHWSVSYMKNAQAGLSPKDAAGLDNYQQAMKNFQDDWAVGYMKAMKNFQDDWAVSYMKNFQDNWAVSYMNSVKNFQDTFSTMYMK